MESILQQAIEKMPKGTVRSVSTGSGGQSFLVDVLSGNVSYNTTRTYGTYYEAQLILGSGRIAQSIYVYVATPDINATLSKPMGFVDGYLDISEISFVGNEFSAMIDWHMTYGNKTEDAKFRLYGTYNATETYTYTIPLSY